mmetsp:Transcript_36009/g.81349  ORF Transcript_36009/g.81349 Transcript_36009/m.81349 type:complete len:261 (+) Transcript_36009:486-1268(+)
MPVAEGAPLEEDGLKKPCSGEKLQREGQQDLDHPGYLHHLNGTYAPEGRALAERDSDYGPRGLAVEVVGGASEGYLRQAGHAHGATEHEGHLLGTLHGPLCRQQHSDALEGIHGGAEVHQGSRGLEELDAAGEPACTVAQLHAEGNKHVGEGQQHEHTRYEVGDGEETELPHPRERYDQRDGDEDQEVDQILAAQDASEPTGLASAPHDASLRLESHRLQILGDEDAVRRAEPELRGDDGDAHGYAARPSAGRLPDVTEV